MVKAKHKGKRSKTTHKLRKNVREKGKPTVNKMMQKFKKDDIVHVKTDPSVHKGMPFRRFTGKTGKILGTRGDCYMVEIRDINAKKKIIVHPVHLKKQTIVKKPVKKPLKKQKTKKTTTKTAKPKPKVKK